jgi:hypothetical protein
MIFAIRIEDRHGLSTDGYMYYMPTHVFQTYAAVCLYIPPTQGTQIHPTSEAFQSQQ